MQLPSRAGNSHLFSVTVELLATKWMLCAVPCSRLSNNQLILVTARGGQKWKDFDLFCWLKSLSLFSLDYVGTIGLECLCTNQQTKNWCALPSCPVSTAFKYLFLDMSHNIHDRADLSRPSWKALGHSYNLLFQFDLTFCFPSHMTFKLSNALVVSVIASVMRGLLKD